MRFELGPSRILPGLHQPGSDSALASVLSHDLGVLARVGGGRHDVDQGVDEGLAADPFEHPPLPEGRAQRNGVDILATVVHVAHGAKDNAMSFAVEVVICDAVEGDLNGGGTGDHRAEQRLLGVEVEGLHETRVGCDAHEGLAPNSEHAPSPGSQLLG